MATTVSSFAVDDLYQAATELFQLCTERDRSTLAEQMTQGNRVIPRTEWSWAAFDAVQRDLLPSVLTHCPYPQTVEGVAQVVRDLRAIPLTHSAAQVVAVEQALYWPLATGHAWYTMHKQGQHPEIWQVSHNWLIASGLNAHRLLADLLPVHTAEGVRKLFLLLGVHLTVFGTRLEAVGKVPEPALSPLLDVLQEHSRRLLRTLIALRQAAV